MTSALIAASPRKHLALLMMLFVLFTSVLISQDRSNAATPDCDEPTLVGTEGDDVLEGTAERDIISGLGGADLIKGGDGFDVLCGDDGNDVIRGGAGYDILYGGADNDELYGQGDSDFLEGQNGDDLLVGGPNLRRTYEGLGGGAGDDILRGGTGSDYMWGDSADVHSDYPRVKDVGDGDDHLDFGTGRFDHLYYEGGKGAVVNLAEGTATGSGKDTMTKVHHVTSRGTVIGTSSVDDIATTGRVYARGGNDRIVGCKEIRGGGGSDLIEPCLDQAKPEVRTNVDGGRGRDWVAQTVSDRANLAKGIITMGEARARLVSIENLFGPVIQTGNGRRNILMGGHEMRGRGGDDVLIPDMPEDPWWNDRIVDGGRGIDIVDRTCCARILDYPQYGLFLWESVRINLENRVIATESGSRTPLRSIERAKGSPVDDVLIGNDRGNRLEGGRGSDHLYGRGGGDLLIGQKGLDWADGGGGRDRCRVELPEAC